MVLPVPEAATSTAVRPVAGVGEGRSVQHDEFSRPGVDRGRGDGGGQVVQGVRDVRPDGLDRVRGRLGVRQRIAPRVQNRSAQRCGRSDGHDDPEGRDVGDDGVPLDLELVGAGHARHPRPIDPGPARMGKEWAPRVGCGGLRALRGVKRISWLEVGALDERDVSAGAFANRS